jgi:hypothetical protein
LERQFARLKKLQIRLSSRTRVIISKKRLLRALIGGDGGYILAPPDRQSRSCRTPGLSMDEHAGSAARALLPSPHSEALHNDYFRLQNERQRFAHDGHQVF